jgi:hypothetical protein
VLCVTDLFAFGNGQVVFVDKVAAAVNAVTPGVYIEVEMPLE